MRYAETVEAVIEEIRAGFGRKVETGILAHISTERRCSIWQKIKGNMVIVCQ